jgi:hypothetical protein
MKREVDVMLSDPERGPLKRYESGYLGCSAVCEDSQSC